MALSKEKTRETVGPAPSLNLNHRCLAVPAFSARMSDPYHVGSQTSIKTTGSPSLSIGTHSQTTPSHQPLTDQQSCLSAKTVHISNSSFVGLTSNSVIDGFRKIIQHPLLIFMIHSNSRLASLSMADGPRHMSLFWKTFTLRRCYAM